MNRLALLLVMAAALVWVGQWISLRALGSAADQPLTPQLNARLLWWAGHRTVVGAACVVVVVGAVTSSLLTG